MIKENVRAWFLALMGGLFFFYSFFQANMMGALNSSLSEAFKADACQIGILSAWSFAANIIFLIPAGLLLDRYSLRKLMLLNMGIVILGTVLFAYSESLLIASIARFICGIMMAFGLIICLKFASCLLPFEKMGLASSLIITIGMFGGVVSQHPLSSLVAAFGWRSAVLVSAGLGLVILGLLWIFIRPKVSEYTLSSTSLFKSLKNTMKNSQNWMGGFFICFLNFPVAILGALFGISYLTQVYGLDAKLAAAITSMLFFGMILGSPFFGWVSNMLKQKKLPSLIGAELCLIALIALLYMPYMSIPLLYVLFFLIGFFSGAQVLGYPLVTENNPKELTGAALSLASILIVGIGYGIGLPVIGKLLNFFANGGATTGCNLTYSAKAYHLAFLSLPILVFISSICVLFLKEKRQSF